MRISGNLTILILTLLFSCGEEVLPPVTYDEVNRTLGPEGGTISFYQGGLPGESGYYGQNIFPAVSLEIPAGALDSMVTFGIRKRVILPESKNIETWEITPANYQFKQQVKLSMTFGIGQEEYFRLENRCFYKPYRIPLDANIGISFTDPAYWQEVDNYELDEESLLYSTTIESLSHIYFYDAGVDIAEYAFCNEISNRVELSLGGDHNYMVFPTGAFEAGTLMDVDRVNLPDPFDYPQSTIGDYVILASSGYFPNIKSNKTELLNEGSVYIHAINEQAGDVLLDWQQVGDRVKFLRVSNDLTEVLEIVDYAEEITNLESRLYGAKISKLGSYVLAVNKSDFLLRFGGTIDVTITGGSTYSKLIEQTSFGGAFIDWLYSSYELNINPGRDDSGGFFYMRRGVGDSFETTDFPSIFGDNFLFKYYDDTDTERWVKLNSFGGELSYSLIDKEGGWLEGELKTTGPENAYNESGAYVEFSIKFKFRIAKWYEI